MKGTPRRVLRALEALAARGYKRENRHGDVRAGDKPLPFDDEDRALAGIVDDAWRARVQELTQQRDALHGKLSAAEARNSELQARVRALSDDGSRLQGERDDALARVRELETELEGTRRAGANVLDEAHRWKDMHDSLQARVRELEAERQAALDAAGPPHACDAAGNRRTDVVDCVRILHESFTNAVAHAQELTQQRDALHGKLSAAEDANRNERSYWSEAMKAMGWTNGTYSMADLVATVSRVVNERAAAEARAERIQQALDETKDEMRRAVIQESNAQDVLRQLRERVRDLDLERDSLQARVRELEAMTRNVSAIVAERDAARREVERMRPVVDTARKTAKYAADGYVYCGHCDRVLYDCPADCKGAKLRAALDALDPPAQTTAPETDERGAAAERARIVEWLRRAPLNGPAETVYADAIERGEHLRKAK